MYSFVITLQFTKIRPKEWKWLWFSCDHEGLENREQMCESGKFLAQRNHG